MKKLLTLSLSFLLSTGVLLAGEMKNEPQTKPAYDADLFKKDMRAVFIDGEFLYWTVEEASLDYAISMNSTAWSTDTNYALGKFKSAKFGWYPGFRVALGYFNAPNYWEVKAEYTWQHIKGSNHTNKPSTATYYLNPTWPDLLSGADTEATSHIKLRYNLLNLIVDRVYVTNPHLRLRLLGGATSTLTKQNWKVHYYDADNSSFMKNKWRYMGIGLCLGVTLDWFWGADFYITGKATTSALMGKYKNNSYLITTDSAVAEGADTSLPAKNATYKDWRAVYMAQFLFGPSYQKGFTSCRFEIFAGYELNTIFNLNELYHSTSGTPQDVKEIWVNRSPTALHGLTTRFSIYF